MNHPFLDGKIEFYVDWPLLRWNASNRIAPHTVNYSKILLKLDRLKHLINRVDIVESTCTLGARNGNENEVNR